MHKTGSTRYQKFLKSEKAKTKLKKKKELPKGTNVTKTNFKVKKIVIREQLKKHGEAEQLSTRKLNIKELLSRLNHFNTNARTDALEGLRELISSHPETLEQHLGQIILDVTPLILNVERVVRRDTLKALQLILSNVQLEKVDPFFDIISAYLRSAMTHIDSRIQEDSLIFLDILLLCTPAKLANDFHRIIPNFLDMISKLNVDAKAGRTLTVNLNSQVTSVKWRIKVIHRLQEYLNKYAQYNQIDNNNSEVGMKETHFDHHKLSHYPLFNAYNTSVCNELAIYNTTENPQRADEANKFKSYANTLMPLLLEMWLEVCPNTKSRKNIESVINEEAAVLLRHILRVILLMCKVMNYLDKRNPSANLKFAFVQRYKDKISQHFVSSFPFVTNIRSKQGKSTDNLFDDVITDPKLITENLEICHLFIIFNPQLNIKRQTEDIALVLTYMENIFTENANENIFNIVLNILHTLFTKKNRGWTKSVTILETLFKKMVEISFNANTPDKFKQKLFALICEIALNEKLTNFHSCNIYKIWLQKIPDILLRKSITVQTVNMIHKFATTNNALFNSLVKPRLAKIVENLPAIEISDCVKGNNSYHKLFSFFYWIKTWDTDSLNMLEVQLMNNMYKDDYGKYIFDTLRLKTGEVL